MLFRSSDAHTYMKADRLDWGSTRIYYLIVYPKHVQNFYKNRNQDLLYIFIISEVRGFLNCKAKKLSIYNVSGVTILKNEGDYINASQTSTY